MKKKVKEELNFFRRFFIEIYLSIVILLNFLDFFELLPSEIDLIKKLLSWTLVALIFYHASISRIFFGHKTKGFDIIFIVTFFIMALPKFVYYSINMSLGHFDMAAGLKDFYYFVGINANLISQYSQFIGITVLIIIASYCALKMKFEDESVMGVFHESGKPPHSLILLYVRVVSLFLLMLAFSQFVFSIMLEWLGWAVDAPLLLAGLLIYSVFYIRHWHKTGEHYTFYMFLEHVANFGEKFFENVISLFHSRKRFYLGVMALLVFHAITDFIVLVTPYITGINKALYEHASEVENALFLPIGESLLHMDVTHFGTTLYKIFLPFVYVLDVIALLSLFLLPAYMWYCVHQNGLIHLRKWYVPLFFVSLITFLAFPLFSMSAMDPFEHSTAGVSIVAHGLSEHISLPDPITILIVIIIVGVLLALLSQIQIIEEMLSTVIVLISLVFFGYYIWLYFTSIFSFLVEYIIHNLGEQMLTVLIIDGILLFITIFVYVGGFLLFAYEIFKRLIGRELHHIQIESHHMHLPHMKKRRKRK